MEEASLACLCDDHTPTIGARSVAEHSRLRRAHPLTIRDPRLALARARERDESGHAGDSGDSAPLDRGALNVDSAARRNCVADVSLAPRSVNAQSLRLTLDASVRDARDINCSKYRCKVSHRKRLVYAIGRTGRPMLLVQQPSVALDARGGQIRMQVQEGLVTGAESVARRRRF